MKALERSYLLRQEGRLVERPQFMFMRVAVAIHGRDIQRAIETYELMLTRRFIHASPTLFHAGTRHAQFSSCFLLPLQAEDVEDMYKSVGDCAVISRYAGGVGLDVNRVSAAG